MEVRVIKDEKGNQWRVAKDVCEILGLGNSREALARLELIVTGGEVGI